MSLELWGGHEATVNRVHDRFFDQTRRSGHHDRAQDLELFAELGLKALRYPVLWERVAPNSPHSRDFAWSDERLLAIRRLGMRPIVGLLHHGSGPAYTNLLDDAFAPGLADHAAHVAQRYPWVDDWTPVNEPLTTARFSCLYGLWYPHMIDERACWHALLNQIDATRLAMRQIRLVNSNARLVQTEDLGFCHATLPLSEQGKFENDRRWLTWDLLMGRVTQEHPLWVRLVRHGFEDRLKAIADDPCPPDIIGINHYLSSERFIDHRLGLHPGRNCAADGEDKFVNVEAVRALPNARLGLATLLEQTWRRYDTSIAITECHNGCTRDEQMRWFLEVWKIAEELRAEGAPIQAVTAWALLGSYDWNHLVTCDQGYYESGAFDLRGSKPRPTAHAKLLQSLARGDELNAPIFANPGWWWRQGEHCGEPTPLADYGARRRSVPPLRGKAHPILIAGRTGTLGVALAKACEQRGLSYILTGREELPLENSQAIHNTLSRYDPSAVINAAGWVRIDEAETQPEKCMGANMIGAENLACACEERGIPFVTFSSDQVFDGIKGNPYIETDTLNPLNVYGCSKAEAERRVLATSSRALVVRTAAFFSPHDRYNFAAGVMRALHAAQPVVAANDEFVSPTYVPDLVDAVLDLLIDGETGIWHLANAGRVSWADFAEILAELSGYKPQCIERRAVQSAHSRAQRPADASLTSARAQLLPSFETAANRFVDAWSATV